MRNLRPNPVQDHPCRLCAEHELATQAHLGVRSMGPNVQLRALQLGSRQQALVAGHHPNCTGLAVPSTTARRQWLHALHLGPVVHQVQHSRPRHALEHVPIDLDVPKRHRPPPQLQGPRLDGQLWREVFHYPWSANSMTYIAFELALTARNPRHLPARVATCHLHRAWTRSAARTRAGRTH